MKSIVLQENFEPTENDFFFQPVELVLLDQQMPVKTGLQVVEELRDFYKRQND